jgi:hypothetical protein
MSTCLEASGWGKMVWSCRDCFHSCCFHLVISILFFPSLVCSICPRLPLYIISLISRLFVHVFNIKHCRWTLLLYIIYLTSHLPHSNIPLHLSMSPSSPPCTPPDSPQMAPSPLQHLPLDAALESHGNDTAFSPKTPSADPARSPLSPCDCRTLKKILEDVQSPSQTASPLLTKRNERHLGIDSSNDRSSDMGDEDEVQYTEKQYDYGDEADEGYADEDKSMDLSDAVDASVLHEDESELVRDDDTCENVWSDGDTIEEIMNAPGKTAPPAPDQDFGGVYLDDQPTLDETKGIKLQRAAIEEVLEQERLDREYQNAVAIEDEALGLDATITEDQEDAIVLSDDSEFQAVEAVQAEMSMSFVDGDMVEEMEVEVSYLIPKAQSCLEYLSECYADLNSSSSLSTMTRVTTVDLHDDSLLLHPCVEHQQIRCLHSLSPISWISGLQ